MPANHRVPKLILLLIGDVLADLLEDIPDFDEDVVGVVWRYGLLGGGNQFVPLLKDEVAELIGVFHPGEDERRSTSRLELHPDNSKCVQYWALMDGHICEFIQGDVLLFLEKPPHSHVD